MKNFKIVNRYGFYSRCISDKLKKTIEPFKRNVAEIFLLYKTFWMPPFYYPNCKGELLPLLEAGASWEVSAFVSQIYLPSSSDSPCPVFFIFLIFQHQFSNVFYIQCRIVISINLNSTAHTFITSFW